MDKPTALSDLKSAIEIHEGSSYEPSPKTGDYLVRRDGRVFACEHLLIDFWGGSHLDDIEFVDAALRDAAEAAGSVATSAVTAKATVGAAGVPEPSHCEDTSAQGAQRCGKGSEHTLGPWMLSSSIYVHFLHRV